MFSVLCASICAFSLLYPPRWIIWSTHGPSAAAAAVAASAAAAETFSCVQNTAQTAEPILFKFYTHAHGPKISTWANFQLVTFIT